MRPVLSALKRSSGNQVEADKLIDKSYWQVYYDMAIYNRYVEEENERITKETKANERSNKH